MTDLTSNLAQAAYRAYGTSTGGLNFRGEPMPTWDDLGDQIQAAWVAAAGCIEKVLTNPGTVAAEQARANYGEVWTELTGYVQEAVDDGGTIDPAHMRDYMQELKTRAMEPIRSWMRDLSTGS